MSRSCGYCFTINNYTAEQIDKLGLLECQYLVYGKEKGVLGTPHLQGYVHFKQVQSLKQIIRKIPGAHVEVRKGTIDQAVDYCKKDGDYFEKGVKPLNAREKGELGAAVYKEAWDLAKQGRIDEINPKLRVLHYRTLVHIWKTHQVASVSNQVLSNEWYHGPSGTGKSRTARSKYPGAYIKNLNKWWDGYEGQETVIIDEWSPNQDKLASYLKIWSDHYPFRAEIKGSSMMIRPVRIIITSNYSIDECFSRHADALPIERRFTEVAFTHRGGHMLEGKLENSQ